MTTDTQRKAMGLALKEVVDAASVDLYANDAPRSHLGASIIGEDCAAKIWFGFRWATHGSYSGQQLRLFNTGQIYEARFVEWFTAAGFKMFPFAENGEQYRITACNGHFGGSLDSGAIYVGADLDLMVDQIGQEATTVLHQTLLPLVGQTVVCEFKTHNQKNFDKLTKHGVKLSHRKHFLQFNTYGTFYGLEHSVYAGYNKNTDEIHLEVHKNDYAIAADMVRKAEEIITAQVRPNRISENETYFECKFCAYQGICHRGEPMNKNCRSCRFAISGPDKSWICSYWNNKVIPAEFIPVGCGQWAQIG